MVCSVFINKTFNPQDLVKQIMPSESESSEIFGSKYVENEKRILEQQKQRARIAEMRLQGLTISDEFNNNPVEKNVKSEYISEMNSGIKNIDESAASDLDITLENLFSKNKEGTKNKEALKKTGDNTEDFQKFYYDDRFGITVHNELTVDYVGTDGSMFDLIEINTKHRDFQTRKQLYDSEEFRPKVPEDPRKYYVFKEQILDTDELNKPSEEVQGKRKATTLSLLERVNKVTRATRVKKAPYTFKRKGFGTNPTVNDDEDSQETIVTEHYDDPALQDPDVEAENWRKMNEVGNFDKLMAQFNKNLEDDLKERERRLNKISTEERPYTEKSISATLRTTTKKTGDDISKTTKIAKKTKKMSSTKTKSKMKTKKTTKSKVLPNVKSPLIKDLRKLNFSTLMDKTTKSSLVSQTAIMKSNFYNNVNETSEIQTSLVKDPMQRTEFLKTTETHIYDKSSKWKGHNNSAILRTMISTPEIKTSNKFLLEKSSTYTSTAVNKITDLLPSSNFKSTATNKTIGLRTVTVVIRASDTPNNTKAAIKQLPTLRLISTIRLLRPMARTFKTIGIPSFKKVSMKTIGIRKLTTKLKKKRKETTTLSKKT